jgi:hypothetical protein
MDVYVHCWQQHDQPLDSSLFSCLTQGNGCQLMVSIGMATRLQPALQLGMKEQQHMRTCVVDNKSGTRQVTRHGCAIS